MKVIVSFSISYFRRVLNVVFFLLGDPPATELYVPTFRNTLFHLYRRCKQVECRHIKFRTRGTTQKKEYIISFVVSLLMIILFYFVTNFR